MYMCPLGCGYCQIVMNQFIIASNELKEEGYSPLGYVQCKGDKKEDLETRGLCSSYNISDYPTLLSFV